MAGTVRIIRVSFLESDIYDGSIPRECYENAVEEEYSCDHWTDAVNRLQCEGLSFDATGADWAANPDGSTIVDYATGRREEVTGHLIGFSRYAEERITDAVG